MIFFFDDNNYIIENGGVAIMLFCEVYIIYCFHNQMHYGYNCVHNVLLATRVVYLNSVRAMLVSKIKESPRLNRAPTRDR